MVIKWTLLNLLASFKTLLNDFSFNISSLFLCLSYWFLALLFNFFNWLWCFLLLNLYWDNFFDFNCFFFIFFGKSFLFTNVFSENFFIFGSSFFLCFEVIDLHLFEQLLSSDSLFCNQSLDFWCFEESFIFSFDFSVNNVFSNIILLSKSKDFSNIVSSLRSDSSWSVSISDAFDFSVSFLDNS